MPTRIESKIWLAGLASFAMTALPSCGNLPEVKINLPELPPPMAEPDNQPEFVRQARELEDYVEATKVCNQEIKRNYIDRGWEIKVAPWGTAENEPQTIKITELLLQAYHFPIEDNDFKLANKELHRGEEIKSFVKAVVTNQQTVSVWAIIPALPGQGDWRPLFYKLQESPISKK